MILNDKTLAQIVTLKPAAAAVFEKHNLDYCCHGKRSLEKACEEEHVMLKDVEVELEKIFGNDPLLQSSSDFNKMDVSELADYIVNKHHRYVNESMPMIHAHLTKVNSKHGDRHPEMQSILDLFSGVKSEMEQHMMKEEKILFPRIREINEDSKSGSVHSANGKLNLSAPIHVMEMEHERAGDILHQIMQITNNYSPPADACTTFRLSFNELKEFELDLHQHVHLENNILFPRAAAMEQKLTHLTLD